MGSGRATWVWGGLSPGGSGYLYVGLGAPEVGRVQGCMWGYVEGRGWGRGFREG